MKSKLTLLACLTPLLLTACASSPVQSDACSWVSPVTVSKADVLTPETGRQILTLDRSIQKNCGKK